MNNRKICVITGTRAEYGLLKPVLRKILETQGLELQLVVTGMHLLPEHGNTIDEIRQDDFKIDKEFSMYSGSSNGSSYLSDALSGGIKEFGKTYDELTPNIVLVLGDRMEPLAAVLATLGKRIAVAHIHGGDKSSGVHIDEQIRHSITKLSHIHFPATECSKKRIIAMGEEKWRIKVTGSPAIDAVCQTEKSADFPSEKTIRQKYNLPSNSPYIICILHPTNNMDKTGFSIDWDKNIGFLRDFTWKRWMKNTLEAVKSLDLPAIVIYPNNDAGSEQMIGVINNYSADSLFEIYKNIRNIDYLALLKFCSAIIGNSTSGIIEASYLRIPAVNIGSRNEYREHGFNVIPVKSNVIKIWKDLRKRRNKETELKRIYNDVTNLITDIQGRSNGESSISEIQLNEYFVPGAKNIKEKIQKAVFDEKFRVRVSRSISRYGDGHAAEKMVKVLKEVKLDDKLFYKQIK